MKKIALAVLALLVLVAGLMVVMLHYRDKGRQPRAAVAKVATVIEGKLSLKSLSDLRVNGRPIVLCGVANQKPASMQPLLLDVAKKALENQFVTCIPVGQGTPCDGRSAATFGRASVVQCRTASGLDVAADLAEKGIFCDLPAQSGGIYRAC